MVEERYILRITPLSPIHIGTGNTFSPLEYKIGLNKMREPTFYVFQPEIIIPRLSKNELDEYYSIIESDNIINLRNFIGKRFKVGLERYSCPVSKNTAKTYKKILNDPINQLLIYEMYRKKSTFSPVIPASSLKGAIRTALLNREIKNGNVNKNYKMIKESQLRREEKQLQQDLFDYTNPKNDPFRSLRLTDCLIKGKKNQLISGGVIYKKFKTGGYENLSIKMLFEIINGINTGGDSHGGCVLIIKKNNYIESKYKIDINKIKQSCNDFFKSNFDNEYNKFYLSSDNDVLKKTLDYLKEEIDNIKYDSFLVRIGRFSQIENVTLDEPYRAPWNKKGYGNTRTHIISDDFQTPLGWIKIDVQQK